MLSPNTIEVLKKLDKRELKRLGDFIKSPYFNSIGKLEDLYDIILKEYPGFSDTRLDDKKIFKNYTRVRNTRIKRSETCIRNSGEYSENSWHMKRYPLTKIPST